jgi:two-component system OmpR family sensor kinase
VRKAFSGVGARLALALLVVLAGAWALVYLIVVPSLESRLVDARVSALARAAPGIARELPADRFRWPDFVEAASASANARVVVYDTVGPPSALVVAGDSQGFRSSDVQRDPIALRAAERHAAGTGTTTHDGERFAEAAAPVPGSTSVVLVSSSLHEAEATARVARERLLLAGGLALVVALAVGYAGAWLFARRLRRLEDAAEEIAAGRFDEPITDSGGDEVGELARALDRMRLRLAQLDHARREFIASASHELRTPVFALGGFLELLRDEELDEGTRREFFATMSEQVDRLAKLATELLDLSRLESGALELRPEPTDVGQLAREVAGEFTPAAQRHESAVRLELPDGPIELDCDPERVAQVLRILLDNALVHTPAGTGVQVSAARQNGHVSLEVSDRGLGIKRQNMPHIFEPFFTSNEEAQGAGLGLAIARELAERMQGRLNVRSAPGSTTFSLVLPG